MPADLPDVIWMARLCEQLDAATKHHSGEQVTIPLELTSHILTALTLSMDAWRDAASLNYLDARSKHWEVREGERLVSAGRLRDAIALAILRFEGHAPPAVPF